MKAPEGPLGRSSGNTPQAIYDQLDEATLRFDMDVYLRRTHVPFRTTATGEYVFACPRCGRDKLYCNARTKLFICHRCADAFKGPLVVLIAALEGSSRGDAARLIVADADANPVQLVRAAPLERDCTLPEHFHPLSDPEAPKQGPFWRYWAKRGFSVPLAKQHGVGYCRVGFYKQRLVVPATAGGVLTTWIARDITGTAERKVYTPTGNSQGLTLFNLDAVRGQDTAVVCEGVFDALRLPQLCVASFGKHLSSRQRTLLQQAGVRRLIFAWDRDAMDEAVGTALRLSLAFDEVRVATLSEKDPAEMTEKEFRACLDAARRVDPRDALAKGGGL